MDNKDMVLEFYRAFQQEKHIRSGRAGLDADIIKPERLDLKMKLIAEEFFELVEAVYNKEFAQLLQSTWEQGFNNGATEPRNLDVVEASDATGDLRYVIEGFDIEAGIPSREVFAEIHDSNMSKLDDNGQPIFSDGSVKPLGKIMKSDNFFEPRIKEILDKHNN